ISNLLCKVSYLTDQAAKYEFLNSCIKKIPHKYKLYNEKASIGLRIIKNNPESIIPPNDLIDILNTSLRLNPSLNNDAWLIKLNLLTYLRYDRIHRSTTEDGGAFDREIADLISNAKAINDS